MMICEAKGVQEELNTLLSSNGYTVTLTNRYNVPISWTNGVLYIFYNNDIFILKKISDTAKDIKEELKYRNKISWDKLKEKLKGYGLGS